MMSFLSVFVFCLLATVALTAPTDFARAARRFVREHDTKRSGWKAKAHPHFMGRTRSEMRKTLGWDQRAEHKAKRTQGTVIQKNLKYYDSLPANFTSQSKWPKCTTIDTIYDQGLCGSCWAFGATESASDRLCIDSNGATNEILSFAQLNSCGSLFDGCNGGSAHEAWSYIEHFGLVSGACYPYYNMGYCPPKLQPCSHLPMKSAPPCWHNDSCVNSAKWTRQKASGKYYIEGVSNIMQELVKNGPVESCFTVYSDFFHYHSGVYKISQGAQPDGGHCVKIVGYGTQDGEDYWLVNNSWSAAWGLNGQFKILRGVDEAGIESDVMAGMMRA